MQLLRSKKIGNLTEMLHIHTDRIGRLNGVVSGVDPATNKLMRIGCQLITQNIALNRPFPSTLETNVDAAFDYGLTCEESQYYLLSLNDAYIIPDRGWVLTKDRHFVQESVFKPEVYKTKGIKDIVIWPKVEQLAGKIVLAYKQWSLNNYYHWMLEFLPKISAVIDPPDAMFFELFKDSRILLPGSLSPWMIQSLDLLGVRNDQLLLTKAGQVQAEQLQFIPTFGKLYNPPRWALDWLRSRFSSNMDSTQHQKKRIFVSRRKAKARKVSNEDQVMQLLSRYGFEAYVLEDMNLKEQISLFSQAEVVVGPHGAGFTNMVFATSATLIEIFEPHHMNAGLYIFAHDCGHYCWYVMAETVDGVNMHVDVDKLERTLELALQERHRSNFSGTDLNFEQR